MAIFPLVEDDLGFRGFARSVLMRVIVPRVAVGAPAGHTLLGHRGLLRRPDRVGHVVEPARTGFGSDGGWRGPYAAAHLSGLRLADGHGRDHARDKDRERDHAE